MPKDIKPTNELVARSLADKLTGNERTDDSVTDTTSPIDFIPYEGIASAGANALAKGIKSAAAKDMGTTIRQLALNEGKTSLEGKAFNPNNPSHVEFIQKSLNKALPHSMDDDYTNGELIGQLMKDPSKQKALLEIPEVKSAIEDSGMTLPAALAVSKNTPSAQNNDDVPNPSPNSGSSIPSNLPQGDQVGGLPRAVESQETSDSIDPDYNSPIDLAAGAAGAGLGSAMARDAGDVVGNELGSFGADIYRQHNFVPEVTNAEPGAIQNLTKKLGVSEGTSGADLINQPGLTQKELNNAMQKANRPKPYDQGGKIKDRLSGVTVRKMAPGGVVEPIQPQSQPEAPATSEVYNLSTGELGTIPSTHLDRAISSGKFAAPGSPINLVDKEGNLGSLPVEQAGEAIQNGYRVATKNDIHEYQMQQKYGEGLGNEAKSAALGFGNTLSFGGLNQALARTGLASQEALREIPNRNPISNTIGTAAGVGVPLAADALSGGALTPALLAGEGGAGALEGISALGSGIKGVSSIGNSVTDAVRAALPESTSLPGQILKSAVSRGAGSATEGAFFGAGQGVQEQALGDPDYNASAFMAHVGYGALGGGILGSIIGTGEAAIPPVISKAREGLQALQDSPILKSVSDKAGDLSDKAMSMVSGKNIDDIKAGRLNRGLIGGEGPDLQAGAKDLTATIQNQLNTMKKIENDAFENVRPQETAKLAESVDPEPARQELTRVTKMVDDAVSEMMVDPDVYNKAHAKKLNEFNDRLKAIVNNNIEHPSQDAMNAFKQESDRIAKINTDRSMFGLPLKPLPTEPAITVTNTTSAADIFKGIDDLKSSLGGKEIKWDTAPTAKDMAAQSILKDLSNNLRSTLEDPEIFGEAAARQQAFNSKYTDYRRAKDELMKQLGFVKLPGDKLNQVKVYSLLQNINDIKGEAKITALKNFLNTSKPLIDEVENSYATLPSKTFNRENVDSLIQRSKDATEQQIQKANIDAAINRLKPTGGESGDILAGAAVHMAGVPVPAIAAYSSLSNPYLTFQRLSKFEAIINKTKSAVSKGASAILKPATGIGSLISDNAGFLGSRATSYNDVKDYSKRIEQIQDLTNNPQLLIQNLTKSTQSLAQHAPNNAQSLQTAQVRALSFLQSKIPAQTPPSPLGKPLPPNKTDINKFNRYYETVENPLGVFKQIKAGMLTPEAIEALSTVHPALYQQMQSEIFDKLTRMKNPVIPYKTKLQLSLFMGKDMDLSMAPQAIASNQVAQGIAQAEQQQKDAQMVKPSTKGEIAIDVSGRSLTPMQQSAQRK